MGRSVSSSGAACFHQRPYGKDAAFNVRHTTYLRTYESVRAVYRRVTKFL